MANQEELAVYRAKLGKVTNTESLPNAPCW